MTIILYFLKVSLNADFKTNKQKQNKNKKIQTNNNKQKTKQTKTNFSSKYRFDKNASCPDLGKDCHLPHHTG